LFQKSGSPIEASRVVRDARLASRSKEPPKIRELFLVEPQRFRTF
jgi:hypothetical protein